MQEKIRQKKPQLCIYAGKCGGCRMNGSTYEETLESKEAYVRKLLKPFVITDGITGMENPWHYRNKVHRVVSYEYSGKRGEIRSGIYAEGTHKLIPVDHCLIENEQAQKITEDVLQLAKEFKIKAYDEDLGSGLLRHILVRTAHSTGELMLVLVLADPVLPGKKNFIKVLRDMHPGITTCLINVNNRKTSMVLGNSESVVFGKGYITDVLCGKSFRISSGSFYQVNSVQTERLYSRAVSYAGLKGNETVIDAYCGIGTIGMAAADHARQVTGVELSREAVRDAAYNARLNHLSNVSFVCGDAGDVLLKMAAKGQRADVVFMDPPRGGSSEEFIRAVADAGAGKVVYISCNPETLARDLRRFGRYGYRAEKAEVFDMFPMTQHVETVVLMSRKDT